MAAHWAVPRPAAADVEEGGETTFPAGTWLDQGKQVQHPYSECGSQGTAVKPRKGDALLFHNLKPSGARARRQGEQAVRRHMAGLAGPAAAARHTSHPPHPHALPPCGLQPR